MLKERATRFSFPSKRIAVLRKIHVKYLVKRILLVKNGMSSYIPYLAVVAGIYLMHSVWIAAVVYHLWVGAILVHNRGRWNRGRHSVANRPLLIALNVLIGLSAGLLLYILWPMLGISHDFGIRLHYMGLTSWLGFGIYYCIVNPTCEELFWRRYLGTSSMQPSRNDALFAGYHMLVLALFMRWEWLPVAFVLLTLVSWIWRHTANRQNGTLLAIGSHFLADLGIVVVAGFYAGRH